MDLPASHMMTDESFDSVAQEILLATGLQLVKETDDEGTFFSLLHPDGQVAGDTFKDLQSVAQYVESYTTVGDGVD
jgi:hypothetical protein